jgi:hypothetical protein
MRPRSLPDFAALTGRAWCGKFRRVSWVRLGVALVLGVSGVIALHALCLHFYPKPQLDVFGLSDFYPLSVFRFRRPRPYQVALALLLVAAFVAVWRRASLPRQLPLALAVGLAVMVISNGLHGVRLGLDFPTATSGEGGIEYFHDAQVIPGPAWLLSHFNAVQYELLEHSRTHPPGPVLLYWLLLKLLREPALISVAISALGLGLTLPALRRWLELTFDEEPAGALLLFAVLPAMQIYGLAVVDAPIAGLFTWCIAEHLDERRSPWRVAAWLFASLFFTFGALFLLPVLVGYDVLRRRSPRRSLSAIAIAAGLLVALKLGFGFDWLAAFRLASHMENEEGFLLLVSWKRYLWYRIGAVAEIALFFTPFLLLLAGRGWPRLKRVSSEGWLLSLLGPLSLAAVLLTGAFKIGEAARICLYVLPYLLLPVVAAFRELDDAGRARTAYSVLGFGVVMQLFGFYQW